jgi:thioester reductase-like protein
MKNTLLLTGATGFLGSHLIPPLVHNNYNIVCLVRSQKGQTASERLQKTLAGICKSNGSADDALASVQVLDGDIGLENFGLDESRYRALKQEVSHVMHCAAMTTFDPGLADLQWNINVQGTENLARFAADSRAAENFHYVSTAYVAGDRRGLVYEDELDKGQGFFNGYEKSKFVAEQLLRRFVDENSLRVTFYRPSIIVGDSSSGRTVLFNGMYLFMRFFEVAKQSLQDPDVSGPVALPVRCMGDPLVTKNLVHIDFVVEMMTALFLQPAAHGRTYHITQDAPPTLELVRQVIEEVLDVRGLEWVSERSFQERPHNEFEQLLHEQTLVYSPYLLSEPSFDRGTVYKVLAPDAVPHSQPMGREALFKLFRYAVDSRWGRKAT